MIKGKIVRLDSPTGNKEDYKYHEHGFFRELQLFENDKLLHSSGANHPESPIYTGYDGKVYFSPAQSQRVFIEIT